MRGKKLECHHLSSWFTDDEGCEVCFARDAESLDQYLLIQRHFEAPDDGSCYVETDDPNFCGFFRINRAVLEPARFEVWLGKRKVEVDFVASREELEDAEKVLKFLIPAIEVLTRDRR